MAAFIFFSSIFRVRKLEDKLHRLEQEKDALQQDKTSSTAVEEVDKMREANRELEREKEELEARLAEALEDSRKNREEEVER